MAQEFLNRALPIFTESGFQTLRNKVVAFAGLGGVGEGAFLALVRCGVTRFRLAKTENRGQTPILPQPRASTTFLTLWGYF